MGQYVDKLFSKAELVKRCVDAVRSGEDRFSVAEREHVNYADICRWARLEGLQGFRGRPKGLTGRVSAMAYEAMVLREKGVSMNQIAANFSISRQRVRQILQTEQIPKS